MSHLQDNGQWLVNPFLHNIVLSGLLQRKKINIIEMVVEVSWKRQVLFPLSIEYMLGYCNFNPSHISWAVFGKKKHSTMFKTETLTHVQNIQNCGSGGRSTGSLERYYYSTHMPHPTLLYYILIPIKQKLIDERLMSTCNYISLGGLCACSVHTCPAFGLIVSHCSYIPISPVSTQKFSHPYAQPPLQTTFLHLN